MSASQEIPRARCGGQSRISSVTVFSDPVKKPHHIPKQDDGFYAAENTSNSDFQELDACKRRGESLNVLTILGATKEIIHCR